MIKKMKQAFQTGERDTTLKNYSSASFILDINESYGKVLDHLHDEFDFNKANLESLLKEDIQSYEDKITRIENEIKDGTIKANRLAPIRRLWLLQARESIKDKKNLLLNLDRFNERELVEAWLAYKGVHCTTNSFKKKFRAMSHTILYGSSTDMGEWMERLVAFATLYYGKKVSFEMDLSKVLS